MPTSDYLTERGRETCMRLFGEWNREMSADQCDTEFQQLLINFVHNGMYSREVISPKVRQLLAVACLTALGRPDQLRGHLRAALRVAEPAEVQEAILQATVYGGFPSSMTALRILAEIQAK